jgi:transposase-like protein
LGKRINATIKELGYPTKNALKTGHREYEQRHDLLTGYVRATPRYSAEQKQAAVDHYLSHDRCAAATLKALGYPVRRPLETWIKELCREIRKRLVGKVARIVPKSLTVKQASSHRIVRQRRKRARGCPENKRERADAVQLQESATRSRGSSVHETPEESSTGHWAC